MITPSNLPKQCAIDMCPIPLAVAPFVTSSRTEYACSWKPGLVLSNIIAFTSFSFYRLLVFDTARRGHHLSGRNHFAAQVGIIHERKSALVPTPDQFTEDAIQNTEYLVNNKICHSTKIQSPFKSLASPSRPSRSLLQ